MSLVAAIARWADGIGARPLVASLATAIYRRRNPGQRFWVDDAGRWVNQQRHATVVSPVAHTMSDEALTATALENWCFAATPQPGDTVIDVGAGVGEETIVFSRMVGPSGRVIAIEAHPETYRCLAETVRRSGLANVTTVEVAVGAGEGVIEIGAGENYLANSIVADRNSDSMTVPMTTLDALAERLEIEKVGLLKMNIEGAEVAAIAGMNKLSRRISSVVVSCHDFLADRGDDPKLRTREACRTLLEEQGFALVDRAADPHPWVRDYLYGSKS